MFLLGVLHHVVVRLPVFQRNIRTTTCDRNPKEKHHLINSSRENLKTYTITYTFVIHKSYKIGTVLFYHVDNSPNTGLYPQTNTIFT